MSNAALFDFGVVGGGPAGLAAALSLARTGLRTALIGPAPTGSDNRTSALFTGSVRLLRNLGAWDLCRGTEPLGAIRIVDDMGALLRAPEVLFTAAEVGLDAFGYNVANADLVHALRRRAAATIELIDDTVTRIEIDADHVRLHLREDRSLCVRLLVGADGRNSPCRSAAGITTRTWRYEQSALTCTFAHQRPHGGVSTEFHRPAGPLTVVPAPGRSSSLVWVERPAIARHLAQLDEAAFRATLELRLQGLLGSLQEMGLRAVFPLSGLTAYVAGRNRVALVGEAAHVIPPIGAQGLNLGLRDAAVLADCVEDALAAGRDIGGAETLSAYARARGADIASRAFAIDLLNRSLISGMLPVGLARGVGLHALKAIGPLRRLAIREGLSPSFATPRLMQGADGPFPLDAGQPPLASPRN
jgi:2-octaprenyl-6-methoxyphenol hydroxylase